MRRSDSPEQENEMDAKEFNTLLDAYLEGNLPPESLSAFQDALDGHPALRKEFEAHQGIDEMLRAFQAPPTPASLRNKVMEVVRAEAVSQAPIETASPERAGLFDWLRTAFGQWQAPAFATACLLGIVTYGVLTHLPSTSTDDALPTTRPVRTDIVMATTAEDTEDGVGSPLDSPSDPAVLPATEVADASSIESVLNADDMALEVPESHVATIVAPLEPMPTEEQAARAATAVASVASAPEPVQSKPVSTLSALQDSALTRLPVSVPYSPEPGTPEPVEVASVSSLPRGSTTPRTPSPMPTASPSYFRVDASQPPAPKPAASTSRATSGEPTRRDSLTIKPLPSAPRPSSSLSGAQMASASETRSSRSRTETARPGSDRQIRDTSAVRSMPDQNDGRRTPSSRVITPPAFSTRNRSEGPSRRTDTGSSRRVGDAIRSDSRAIPSFPASRASTGPKRDIPTRVASVATPALRRSRDTDPRPSTAFESGTPSTTAESPRRQGSTRDRSIQESHYSPRVSSRPPVVFDVYLSSGRSSLTLRDIEKRLQKRKVLTFRGKPSHSQGRSASLRDGRSRESGASSVRLVCSVRGRDATWVAKQLDSMDLKSAKAWRGLRGAETRKAKGYFSATRGSGPSPASDGASSSSDNFVFELHIRQIPTD